MSEEKNEQAACMLPTGEKLVLSSSPHISAPDTVRKIMYKVLLALVPAVLAGIWFFGLRALLVIVATVVFCVGAEALWCALAKKPVRATIADGSAAVTGVLLALNLPPAVPLYVPLIGAFLAIWLGKQVYGGIGNNPFNPALVARVGLLIALPAAMTSWTPPRGMDQNDEELELFCSPQTIEALSSGAKLDAVTCATPLGIVSTTPKIISDSEPSTHATPKALAKMKTTENNFEAVDNNSMLWNYFIGRRAGCIGETCAPALLLGAVILIVFNLINWRVPLCFAGTVVVTTGIVNFFFPGVTPTPLFHLLTGGLLLGAIFMATDMVTCPITGNGCVIFAIGCGVITSVIRIWGNYPEGVSFSILFMNALVPLIDRWCSVRPFGYVPLRKGGETK